MNQSLKGKIVNILREILEMSEEDNAPLIKEDNVKWDSLKHLEIILAFEEEFSIRFTSNEVINIKSIDDLIEIIGRKYDTSNYC